LEKDWLYRADRYTIAAFTGFINHRGELIPGADVNKMNEHFKDIVIPVLENLPGHEALRGRFNPDRSGMANFRNLQRLSINCP
jgi:hypothetical protein